MGRKCPHFVGAVCSLASIFAGGQADYAGIDVLVMADIGHPREVADDLVSPWPMGKSAYEGAFSLYDGLRDYIENQGAKPKAVFVLGDVAYGGGEARVLNSVKDAFQKYSMGVVPEDMVFPSIGNHDIHFLGCTPLDFRPYPHPCYYGSNYNEVLRSTPGLNYSEWRANWFTAFPGLGKHTIAPPSSKVGDDWSGMEPSRYIADINKESSVYLIVGLATGSHKTGRTSDTPRGALEEEDLQCSFLRDALANGRRLGKSVLVYLTHDMSQLCQDFTLIQQVDIWIFGHKHDYWQNMAGGSSVVQEKRFFPAMVLMGNGGFDEAHIDVVSFGHMREEVYEQDGQQRVRINLDILDTCISDETCPSSRVGVVAHCWERCKSMDGGYDSGGGPRKATPSKYNHGFTFDAPRRPLSVAPMAPFNGTWKLQATDDDHTGWLALGPCPSDGLELPTLADSTLSASTSLKAAASGDCLVSVASSDEASKFSFYDGDFASSSSRIAAWSDTVGPVVVGEDDFLRLGKDFWYNGYPREPRMSPSEGTIFAFSVEPLLLRNVEWKVGVDAGIALQAKQGTTIQITAHDATSETTASSVIV